MNIASLITTENILKLVHLLPNIALAFLGLGFLIAFHEFGHLLFAKLFNVLVPSYSIGFGPRLIKKKIGETEYSISAIPLGGYVELAGAQEVGQGEQEYADLKGERSFSEKSYWQKMLIIGAGIIFNLIFAYVALAFIFSIGAPSIDSRWCNAYKPVIAKVNADSIASKAGIKEGDTIVAYNNQKIDNPREFIKLVDENKALPEAVTIVRAGQQHVLNLEQNNSENSDADKKNSLPTLGVEWVSLAPQSIIESFKLAGETSWNIIKDLTKALLHIHKTKGQGLGGPIILISMLLQFLSSGFKTFLVFLSFISINLAVFNLIPLPIFDGGQALFYTIEAIVGRPLSNRAREIIHYATWIFVILLTIYLTYSDILNIHSHYTAK